MGDGSASSPTWVGPSLMVNGLTTIVDMALAEGARLGLVHIPTVPASLDWPLTHGTYDPDDDSTKTWQNGYGDPPEQDATT